ncbi:MAG: zinc metallopeptidase [Lachnospiraceae bacterium]|nr:zinc metallopeptidase [Lachnospiraceae bacterium]
MQYGDYFNYGYRYGNGGFGASYILIIIGALLCLITSGLVKSTFNKYAKVMAESGMTGREVAEAILKKEGIYDVRVERVAGSLTDHFNPKTKTVNLSETVYDSTSVAAISVAAHECGHAMQHNEEYLPLRARSAILPAANFGSKYGLWIVILGLFISFFRPLVFIGVVLFAFGVLFQLVTLPVEFDASARALSVLPDMGILAEPEMYGAKKVLKSAAMTYVASAAASILSLIRIILIARGGRGRRD